MTNAYATSYESHLSGAFGGEPVSDDVEEVGIRHPFSMASTQLIQLVKFPSVEKLLKTEQKRTVLIRV